MVSDLYHTHIALYLGGHPFNVTPKLRRPLTLAHAQIHVKRQNELNHHW